MARQYWIDGDFGESGRERRVIRICDRVTQIDPDYAQAWALMGLAQANLRYAYSGHDEEDDGLAAANRALALDPTIAEAHLPRAWHLAMLGRDKEAHAEIEMALQLNPEFVGGQQGSGARLLSPRPAGGRDGLSRKGDRACRNGFPQPRHAFGPVSGARRTRTRRGPAPRR